MFFNRNDDLDDSDFNDRNRSKKNTKSKKKGTFKLSKTPLIIIGIIPILIAIIFVTIKLIKPKEIAYDFEKIYYINLEGSSSITLYQGEIFVEPGYKGTDDEGNDLTQEVAVVTNINSDIIGNYKVSYTLGNITKERNIKVIEKPIGATVIHLYGDVNVFLYVGEEYVEKRCEVIDTIDMANLNDKVIINSNVNTEKEGIYKVIYSVTNSSGVTTSKERTVIVMDRNLSLIPSSTEVTNGNVTINIYARDEMFDYLILPNNMKETKSVSTYEVNNNGTYKFTMYSKNGESREKNIEITNIDREMPSGSCSGYYGDGVSKITIKAKDNVGISRYEIDGTSYTSPNIKLDKEYSSVSVNIYDKAGNMSEITCKLQDKGPSSSSSKPSSSSMKPEPIKYKKELSLKHFDDPGFSFDYWLNVPDNATEGLPLLIFLHGGCNIHDPNAVPKLRQVDYVLNEYSGAPFIYLAPVNGRRDWHSQPEISLALKSLLDKTVKDFKINTKKIYIMGFSMGTIEVWNLVNLYPNYFAAAVPISCCPLTTKTDNYLHTKIYAISGTVDPNNEGYYNICMTNMVNKINKAGGSAEKETYEKTSHSTISGSINYKKVFDWLLAQ